MQFVIEVRDVKHNYNKARYLVEDVLVLHYVFGHVQV